MNKINKIFIILFYIFLFKNIYCEIIGNIDGSEINFYNGTTKVATWKLLPDGVFNYEGELINGEIKIFSGDKNNAILTIYKIKNNIIQDDIYKWNYITGEPAGEEIFNKGKLNGEFTWYYKNGKVSKTGIYKDGKKEGQFKWYFESGKIAQEGKYKAGLKNGVFKIYYENGTIKELITFLNNRREGSYQQFYDTGTIKVEGNFKNNLKDGKFIYYFESGEEAGIKIFNKGKLISEQETNEGDMEIFDLDNAETINDI
jgi:antitoxin component YwqK of YwqJK toxin-antitoxin module